MARAPFNIHVLPYRIENGEISYAILKRADSGIWQGIAGGGEDAETVVEAARRESYEECGISRDAEFMKLSSITPIPVVHFAESHRWGEDVYVIPQHAFGVDIGDHEICLSSEHTEYRWLDFENARSLLFYDNNQNDLWELNQRLKGKGPRG